VSAELSPEVVEPPPRFLLRPAGLLTQLCSAGALLLGTIAFVLVQQNRALHRENNTLAGQNQWMEKELTRSEQFVRMLSAPGAKYTILHGSEQTDAGTGHLVYDRTGNALLMVDGLPSPPVGKEYQLWFIVGKNPPVPGRTPSVWSSRMPRRPM
jgi:hypothetical protein